MISGTASQTRTTLTRLGLADMAGDFYMNGRSLFDVIGSSYVPVLFFLDSEGNLTNVAYFDSNSQVLKIVSTVSGTLSK